MMEKSHRINGSAKGTEPPPDVQPDMKTKVTNRTMHKNKSTSLPNRNPFSSASSADDLIISIHIPFLLCMCNK